MGTGRNSRPNRSNGAPSMSRGSSCGTLDSFFPPSKMYGKQRWMAGHGLRRRVDRDAALLPEIERPHIVQAHDVVGVRVGEDHGVQAVDAGAQSLRAEIGRGVDQHVAALVAHQDGGPQPVVARIGGSADGAMAADGGHAHAGARTQHGDFDGGRRHSGFLGRRFGHFVRDLDETEPQLGKGILQQPLLFERRDCPWSFRAARPCRSMLWRARRRSGSGFSSSPKCIRPSCISACVRNESTRKPKDAGGSGNGTLPVSVRWSLRRSSTDILQRRAPAPRRRAFRYARPHRRLGVPLGPALPSA